MELWDKLPQVTRLVGIVNIALILAAFFTAFLTLARVVVTNRLDNLKASAASAAQRSTDVRISGIESRMVPRRLTPDDANG